MAEDPRFILHFKTLEKFNEKKSEGVINDNRHLVFIKKPRLIYCRGEYYADGEKLDNLEKIYNDWELTQNNDSTVTITLKGKQWNKSNRTWEDVSKLLTIQSATQSIAGLMSAVDKTELDRITTANYGLTTPTHNTSTVVINSTRQNINTGATDTSNSQTINGATASTAGVMTTNQYTQLYTTLPNAISQEIKDRKDAIAGLDADVTSTDGTNVQVQVVETDGKITEVNITTDNTINSGDLTDAINALDATVRSGLNTSDNLESGKHVGIKVVETDGKLTSVLIKETDIASANTLSNHINNKSNPHEVTKAQVGLENVDNVQQIPLSQKAAANGVATLDANSKLVQTLDASKIVSGTISIDRLPQGALERLTIVANATARKALTNSNVQNGDTVKESDTGLMYYVKDDTKLNQDAGWEVYTAGSATTAGYATTAGTANSVDWSNVSGRPTNLNQFTNGPGYVTSSGVTSVATAGGGHITLSGGTITSTGTITAGVESGYAIPSDGQISNWNTAYGWGDHSKAGYSKNDGTVTSVAMTVPTGLSVSGTPITSSGTLAISLANGYSIPTTEKQTAWDGKQNAISDLATIRSNASNGNTAYGWGNHADAGYLTSIDEYNYSKNIPGLVPKNDMGSISDRRSAIFTGAGWMSYNDIWVGNASCASQTRNTLTFTGAVEETFNGFKDVTIDIPTIPTTFNINEDGLVPHPVINEPSDYNNLLNANGSWTKTNNTLISGSTLGINLNNRNTWKAYQDFTAGAGNSSDIRYKTNITPLDNVLDKVQELDIFNYTWSREGDPEINTFGVSAQQLEELGFEKIVHGQEVKSVEYDHLGVISLKAIQELTEIVKKQQKEIEELKAKLS